MIAYEFHQPLAKSTYFQRLIMIMLAFTGILLWNSSFPLLLQILCLAATAALLYPFVRFGKPHTDALALSYAHSKWQLNDSSFNQCQCLVNTPFFYLLRLSAESGRPRHLLLFKDQIKTETLRKMQMIWFICPE